MYGYIRSTLIFLAAVALPLSASAHQPVYLGNSTAAVTIPDPVISRAYYGELNGKPAEYTVVLATTTKFYMDITAPNIAGARTDFDAIMRNANGEVVLQLLHGTEWPTWYEEFGGDMYLKGPEERKELPAGTYRITVDNPSHSGKYVLAPGEEEVFTLGGTPETIHQIYLMKTKFFGKPPYTIFEGIIGHVLLGILIAIIMIVGIFSYFFLKPKRSRH